MAKKKKISKSTPETSKSIIDFIDKKVSIISERFGDNYAYEDMKNVYPAVTFALTKDNDLHQSNRKFDNADDIMYSYKRFQYIIYLINLNTLVIPSRELYCMFMGWNTDFYIQMSTNSLDEIMQAMKLIDDYIIDSQLAASQSGLISPSTTKFKMQVAGGNGQGLVTQKEQNDDNRHKKLLASSEDISKKVEQIRKLSEIGNN